MESSAATSLSKNASCSEAPNVSSIGKPNRSGVALCLSGGGFRSALFHLGALRRLKEIGLLHRVELISSVSGGSILAGFLATTMASGGPVRNRLDFERWLDEVDWDKAVASRDFRTLPVLSNVLWNWAFPGLRLRALERRYQRRISRRTLGELPEYPAFVICATNPITSAIGWKNSLN